MPFAFAPSVAPHAAGWDRYHGAPYDLPNGGDHPQALVRRAYALGIHLELEQLVEQQPFSRGARTDRVHEQEVKKPPDERTIGRWWKVSQAILAAAATMV